MKRVWKTIGCILAATVILCVSAPAPCPGQTAPKIKAALPAVRLEKAVNYQLFTKQRPLTDAQRAFLQKNLFVCTPTADKQLFDIYRDNSRARQLPSFVTTDALLQLYHVFFDWSLRRAEERHLLPALKTLTQAILRESLATWNAVSEPRLKRAALKNVAYFAVAARLFSLPGEVPEEAEAMVAQELSQVAVQQGPATSAIFPYTLDYSQFAPRGHYTQSEAMQQFFRVQMWYGLAPFAVRYYTAAGDLQRADEQILQGLLWTHTLHHKGLSAAWRKVYEPLEIFVGFADDQTPDDWHRAMRVIYGASPRLNDLADNHKLDLFVKRIESGRSARIQAALGAPAGFAHPAHQLRFLGQRYVPDSEIMQRLTFPVTRPLPTGLDIMAVLGSRRAGEIMRKRPEEFRITPEYSGAQKKLLGEFAAVPQSTWVSNSYWNQLHALRALLAEPTSAMPAFMQSDAWRDKSLNTALGSWALLRHDTLLYSKQGFNAASAEMGWQEGNYVEPNVAFWGRLLALTKSTSTGLQKFGFLTKEETDDFDAFEKLLASLQRVSAQQLRGEEPNDTDLAGLENIGATLKELTMRAIGLTNVWDLLDEKDKDIATIADVYTGQEKDGYKALEVGVGRVSEIIVLVPGKNGLYLTRGAVFTYHEFAQPVAARLTDEQWQSLLARSAAPPPPNWTQSFLLPRPHAPYRSTPAWIIIALLGINVLGWGVYLRRRAAQRARF